jgi:hypothetical protein
MAPTEQRKILKIRRPDRCAACGTAIEAGQRAQWDSSAMSVTCLDCVGGGGPTVPARPSTSPPSPADAADASTPQAVQGSVAGSSARAMGDERREAQIERRRQLKGAHPVLGRMAIAWAGPPTDGESYLKGAVGEEKLGGVLDSLGSDGLYVLHDRRRPRTKANIDHLVVTAAGVWIIDAKRYSGLIEKVDKGGWFKTDERLVIGGRDRSGLLNGVDKQTADVRTILDRHDLGHVEVFGALCFVDAEVRFFAKPFVIREVLVTWRKAIRAPLLEGGDLDDETRRRVHSVLASSLPPA